MGRYASQDPKGFGAGDTNPYRYVGNEPTAIDHPTGEQAPYDLPVIFNGGAAIGFHFGGGHIYLFGIVGGTIGSDPDGSIGGGVAVTPCVPDPVRYQFVYIQPIYGYRVSPEFEVPITEPIPIPISQPVVSPVPAPARRRGFLSRIFRR